MSFKKNKKKVRYIHREELREVFFSGKSIKEAAKKLGYDYPILKKYLQEGQMTKQGFIDGIEKRRCSACITYKTLDNFGKNKNGSFDSRCKACKSRQFSNQRIIKKNMNKWDFEKRNEYQRERRKNNVLPSRKYEFRRKLIKILGMTK